MIFYFSSTGNSKEAAEKIAAANGDTLTDIGRAMKFGEMTYELKAGEDLGIVTPVYYGGIPDIVYEFLKKVNLKGQGTDRYVYHVVTCGSVTGGANSMVMSALSQNFGLTISATYAIKTVDNYLPLFDCSDKEANQKRLASAEKEMDQVAAQVAAKDLGEHNYYRGAWALLWPVEQFVYEYARSTNKFHVTDACISCGLCARNCPCNAIAMNNGKPAWVKEKCTLCLGCVHRCPAHAIQFGRSEKARAKAFAHGQYQNPDTAPVEY